MRKSVFFILLATAAMPALAAAQDRDDDGDRDRGTRAERSENTSDERPQRALRAEARERSNSGQADQAVSVQRAERGERIRMPRAERSQQIVQSPDGSPNQYSGRRARIDRRSDDGGQRAPVATSDGNEGVTNWRSRERRAGRFQDRAGTTDSTNWRERSRDGQASTIRIPSTTNRQWDGDRDGHRRWNGDRDGRRRWTGDWRRDNRYDWRRHRSRYSSLFRVGRYYDPYRYGYRRFSIGLTLGSGYYRNNNYWLNDPWQYRLPPAYGPYRWVRYYNDALLVDMYSGEVVDVIYGFFW